MKITTIFNPMGLLVTIIEVDGNELSYFQEEHWIDVYLTTKMGVNYRTVMNDAYFFNLAIQAFLKGDVKLCNKILND